MTLRTRCLLLLGLLLPAPAQLAADGFGVYEHGARASGMGGAWVARVMDPSAVFYNVGGLTDLPGTQLLAGASAIFSRGTSVTLFDSRTFDGEKNTFVVPHVYLTHQIDERFTAGIGVFSPYGLGSGWDNRSFPGRFRAYDTDLRTFYVQPSAAWAPSAGFSVGAGVDFVYADLALNRQADLSRLALTPEGTTFGQLTGLPPNSVAFLDTELDAVGTGFGFNLGVVLKPSRVVQLGAMYRSEVTVGFDGDARFVPLETGIVLAPGQLPGVPGGTPLDAVLAPRLPVNQKASTELTLPDQIVAGVSISPDPRWVVNGDVKWTNWEDFDVLVLEFENANPGRDVLDPRYENSMGFRIGSELMVTPAIALRAGYIRDETPAPERSVTPLLPDTDRNDVSLGLGYTTGRWQVDAYWLGVFFEDREGVVGADDDLVDGTYRTTVHLFGADLGVRF